MDSRSIDSAKTATIDMMALNNKVVNMRQVVKRTKVQVINKLSKQIKKLKMKKGKDEQRAKNVRKAERFIEEIDSVKKLKEDKVSKYALANTASFNEVSKISTHAGPRALARLADHPLMKKVVTEFREQHSDWRDLAAYLLVKQTGRRFKTKKQKQKKHSKTVENINASEVMTKAYIQERFGQEGLAKAEERFERKRKRGKLVPKTEDNTDFSDNLEGNKQKTMSKTESGELVNENTVKVTEEKQNFETVIGSANTETSKEYSTTVKREDSENKKVHMDDQSKLAANNGDSDNSCESEDNVDNDQSSTVLSDHEDDSDNGSEGHDSDSNINLLPLKPSSDGSSSELHVKKPENLKAKGPAQHNNNRSDGEENDLKRKKKSKSECVVKKLNMGEGDSDSELSEADDAIDEDSESSIAVSSDSEQGMSKVPKESDDSTDSDSDSSPKSKKSKKLKKQVPEFLTKPTKMISDPFFAGSGDEGEDDVAMEDDEEGYVEDLFENTSDGDHGFRKHKIESMFHNPHSSDMSGGDNWSKKSFSRGSFRGRDGFGQRGRASFQGQRAWRGRGRGGNFRDTRGARGRGGSFGDTRGARGRGGSFGDTRGARGRGHWSRGGNERNFRSERRGGHIQDQHIKRFGGDRDSELKDSHRPFKDDSREAASKTDEKLHPSWEASKKRKAEQSGIVAFKGSKMTFDD